MVQSAKKSRKSRSAAKSVEVVNAAKTSKTAKTAKPAKVGRAVKTKVNDSGAAKIKKPNAKRLKKLSSDVPRFMGLVALLGRDRVGSKESNDFFRRLEVSFHPRAETLDARWYRYGATGARVRALMIDQSGQCGICEDPLWNGVGGCAVDHDHLSGKIRGLLCQNCNTALGKFNDDPQLLLNALLYLQEHS